ncbi:hypothetical protein MKY96_26155 [Paenibacillus sp. FSL R7-0302]|uniref:hypothetical protein n=1 Tax=Paenibacillus sp. FSL R7-0302 TaxID=2921681 RepID=UPI0030F6BD39
MHDHSHEYAVRQYKECNDLGMYFAYIRHELISRKWMEQAGTNEIIVSTNIMNTYTFDPDISKYKEIANLDSTIYRFVNGSSIEILRSIVELYTPLLNSEFWVGLTLYINSLLALLTPASKFIHRRQIREELHCVYNDQFNRLTQRIGSKEFAVIIC